MAPAVLSVSLTNDAASTAQVITKAPASLTSDTSAHFEFSDPGKHGSFQCKLDKALFVPCGPGGTGYYDPALGWHLPQACWPVLTMSDLPIDQNACAGATFELMYLGRATQQ